MATELQKQIPVTVIKPKLSRIPEGNIGLNIIDNPGILELYSLLKTTEKVYCRIPQIFLKYYILKKLLCLKFVIYYDFRGLISEESYFRNNNNFKKRILQYIEKIIYKYADQIGTVSNNFAKYLNSKYGYREVQVTPCGINEIVLKNWQNFAKNEEIRFVYVGGLSKWQKFDTIVKIYASIENQVRTSLTVYTTNQEEAKDVILKNNLKNYNIETLNQKELLKVLPNYDFGFLIRDNILLNQVASPVKFLEYTSHGVIPIISEGVGDYSSLVKENNLGILVNNNDNNKIVMNEIQKLLNDFSIFQRLFQFSQNYLWENLLQENTLCRRVSIE